MEIKEEKRGEVKVIGLRGRLDTETSPGVRKRLKDLIDQGESRFVLDFSELTYISSAGLRVVVELAKALQRTGGKLGLSALNDHVLEVFKISGLVGLFSIHFSRDEALTYAQSNN